MLVRRLAQERENFRLGFPFFCSMDGRAANSYLGQRTNRNLNTTLFRWDIYLILHPR